MESGRHAIQARYQRRVQSRFGPSGPPWMQRQNKEDDDPFLAGGWYEEEVAHQARIQLEQEEDAARHEAKRDAKRARAWAADINALDSGTYKECDMFDPRNDALDFSTS